MRAAVAPLILPGDPAPSFFQRTPSNLACCFVFCENWRSQADLVAHLAMPHLQPLFSHLDHLLAAPVEIRHFTMVSDFAPN